MSEADILKKQVPSFLVKSPLFQKIYNSQGDQMDKLNDAVSYVLAQYFVNNATSIGVEMWESFLGITADINKPDDYRKTAIIAKMRGIGTVTVAMMKNVANSFDNGSVDIIEHNERYSFTLKFISNMGIPPNLQDLKNAIEVIKPAHLAIEYEFSYLLIKDIHLVMKLTEMGNTTLNKFAGGVPIVK